MLCWGYSSFGQPGIGSNLQVIIPEPQVCGFIHDRNVKEVACGGNHSVFLLEDGEVYTCGLNTKGQLGHDCEGSKPGKSAFYMHFKLSLGWWAEKIMEAALLLIAVNELTELKIMCNNTVMMLNNICWLWKAEAQQYGWRDRSPQCLGNASKQRRAQMVSGQIVLFGIMLRFYKKEERAMSHKCLCFVFAIALHPYAYSCSVIAGNFVVYIKEKRSALSTVVENKPGFSQEGL